MSGKYPIMTGVLLKSYWRELVAIIEGGLKPDPHRVASFSEHLAQLLQDADEKRLATRIRRLVDQSAKPSGSTFETQALLGDVEAQQSLVEQILPVGLPTYPVLPSSTGHEIRRFVELNRRAGELESAGLKPPTSLLFFGPPGCGKTMASIAVACDLDLPLYLVRLDSLLGSFLGNSAKNLRRVFDNAYRKPCVLLLDEFDAVAKMRDDAQEVGEVKRLVVSLLQNLDRVHGQQIVIAATNHHHVLDSAIWRRFDVTLKFDALDNLGISELISRLTSSQQLSNLTLEAVARLCRGLSGHEITSIVNRALQDEFLYPEQSLLERITRSVLFHLNQNGNSSSHLERKKDLILATHYEAGGDLTVRQVAALVSSSVSYAHEVIKASDKGMK